jgi:putative transposase
MAPAVRDAAVIDALQAIVADHGRWGFWKCFDRLGLDGQPWNHKRVDVPPILSSVFV